MCSAQFVLMSGTTENEGILAREFISPMKIASIPLVGYWPTLLRSTFAQRRLKSRNVRIESIINSPILYSRFIFTTLLLIESYKYGFI